LVTVEIEWLKHTLAWLPTPDPLEEERKDDEVLKHVSVKSGKMKKHVSGK